MTVAIVGDSFVWRLERFVDERELRDFGGLSVSSRFFGQGGAVVRGRRPVLPLLNRVIALPDLQVIYLHIGTNDLAHPRCDPFQLAQNISALAKYAACSSSSLQVVIGQIHMRRYPQSAWGARFQRRVVQAHDAILRHIQGCDRITVNFIGGLCRPNDEDYSDDVHFNDRGMHKFYRGVRGAIIRASIYI